MIKIFKNLIISFFITIFLFLNISFVLAQETNTNEAIWKIPELQIKISNKLNYTKLFPKPVACKDRPELTCVYWLGNYINEIYKYAIGIVGILAAVVLMIGGVIWITAGGSASRIGEAKSWIFSSLTGLIIALTTYLILFQINPDLVKITPIGIKEIAKTASNDSGNKTYNNFGCCLITRQYFDNYNNPISTEEPEVSAENTMYSDCMAKENSTSALEAITVQFIVNSQTLDGKTCTEPTKPDLSNNDICQKYATNNVIDFYQIQNSGNKKDPIGTCENYNFSNSAGVDPKLLRAIAQEESSCRADSNSSADACGLMQLKPSTVNKDCQWLKDHPQESIELAANYIKNDCSGGNNYDAMACYNGGPDAINDSDDCPGNLKYECCINSGELGTETQPYVRDVILYYNGL